MKSTISKTLSRFWKHARPIFLSKIALSLVIASIITGFTMNFNFFRVEAFFYDFRMRLKGDEGPHSKIHLVILDNIEVDLNEHLHMLEKIIQAKHAAIAYLNK